MDESACPYCGRPVSHGEGRLTGQTVTLSPVGGTPTDREIRKGDCPHCGKPIMRAEEVEAVWHRDNRRDR